MILHFNCLTNRNIWVKVCLWWDHVAWHLLDIFIKLLLIIRDDIDLFGFLYSFTIRVKNGRIDMDSDLSEYKKDREFCAL